MNEALPGAWEFPLALQDIMNPRSSHVETPASVELANPNVEVEPPAETVEPVGTGVGGTLAGGASYAMTGLSVASLANRLEHMAEDRIEVQLAGKDASDFPVRTRITLKPEVTDWDRCSVTITVDTNIIGIGAFYVYRKDAQCID